MVTASNLHVPIALVGQSDGVVPEVIAKIGARPQTVQSELQQMLADRPRTYGSNAQLLSRAAMMFSRAEKKPPTCTMITCTSTSCWRWRTTQVSGILSAAAHPRRHLERSRRFAAGSGSRRKTRKAHTRASKSMDAT
jgi:hypothetical protein